MRGLKSFEPSAPHRGRTTALAVAARAAAAFLLLAAFPVQAAAFPASTPLRPDQAAFRDLYRELVETNTTLSGGSCTLAAQRMGARLKAAGYANADLTYVTAPDHPREGGLVAVLHGTDPSAPPMLLLAHIDVVEANRADWARDPFTLVEENGNFYARGSNDDKAMAAVEVDTLVRFRREGFRPRRDVKLALTCGEETEGAFNGAKDLVDNHRSLIDAAFALNEGGGGRLDTDGRRVALSIQAGEKVYQDFTLLATSPGGHSSRPTKGENAIVHLAAALVQIGGHEFPVQLNEVTRAYFAAMGRITPGETGEALTTIASHPDDASALDLATRDPSWNSMLRTTCTPTLVKAGHALNALPQRAEANVNCRIFPSDSVDAVRATLVQAIGDPRVAVTPFGDIGEHAPVPPLSGAIMGPVRRAAAKVFPGVPIVPTVSTGATDGRYLNAAGIPTYGLTGMFDDPDGDGVHGLNERIRVRSLYDGRDFLYAVVRELAAGRIGVSGGSETSVTRATETRADQAHTDDHHRPCRRLRRAGEDGLREGVGQQVEVGRTKLVGPGEATLASHGALQAKDVQSRAVGEFSRPCVCTDSDEEPGEAHHPGEIAHILWGRGVHVVFRPVDRQGREDDGIRIAGLVSAVLRICGDI